MTSNGAPTEHGLIIGKFYPPHAGHHLLIRTAAATCTRVTVLVFAHEAESIPLADRIAWLREAHAADLNVTIDGAMDDHPVVYDDPAVWDLHMAVFRQTLARVNGSPVTAVFSSEAYGAELARRLGAKHVEVDVARTLLPISGTMVRADPVGHWDNLSEPVRGAFAKRVIVLGAESTGKTTFSRALVDSLRARGGVHGLTRWVPEYFREFTIDKLAIDRASALLDGRHAPAMDELVWRTDEFVTIARRQNEMEDAAARRGGPVLICDTDVFATGIWQERYQGFKAPAVDALGRAHPLYLLTHHDDVPFVQDGIRDGEAIRAWMTQRFMDELTTTKRHTVVLRGSHEQRLTQALAATDQLLTDGWQFGDPVTPANTNAVADSARRSDASSSDAS